MHLGRSLVLIWDFQIRLMGARRVVQKIESPAKVWCTYYMEICLEICGIMIIWNLPDADGLIYYSGHFGAIKFPFTILHPYFMAEIAEILKKICPACKSIRHELRIKVRYLLLLPTLAQFIWVCYNRDLVLNHSILYNPGLNIFLVPLHIPTFCLQV